MSFPVCYYLLHLRSCRYEARFPLDGAAEPICEKTPPDTQGDEFPSQLHELLESYGIWGFIYCGLHAYILMVKQNK